ncbi:hypothetical protein I3843_07G116400 [Carya illinoinensis]|uniref:Uncharacterized protein n=1 Tax=Carya illinoinensis TaxID=32201 RepID=A0A922ELJ7_CARIL|nr:hypothetical protein I3760_07G116700 [Carya illinoinensis]KAG6704145.1 hypothetical protein I3842_07G121200 [Carya illinoinensis]KAG7971059.1 hypothetical protein I3843_07G116400 [Carya illinoinensis]
MHLFSRHLLLRQARLGPKQGISIGNITIATSNVNLDKSGVPILGCKLHRVCVGRSDRLGTKQGISICKLLPPSKFGQDVIESWRYLNPLFHVTLCNLLSFTYPTKWHNLQTGS